VCSGATKVRPAYTFPTSTVDVLSPNNSPGLVLEATVGLCLSLTNCSLSQKRDDRLWTPVRWSSRAAVSAESISGSDGTARSWRRLDPTRHSHRARAPLVDRQ